MSRGKNKPQLVQKRTSSGKLSSLLPPLKKSLSSQGLQYANGVEYDYDMDYSCQDSGCDEEGICRCGSIFDTSVSIQVDKLARSVYGKFDETTYQAIEMILTKGGAANEDNWEVLVGPGYYGDEIDGVNLDPGVVKVCNEQVQKMLSMPESKRLSFAASL